MDSDQQANMAWLLSVRQKCTSRAGTALRLYHDSWRAGCVSKGARPVRRGVMGNRRRQRRTAPTIYPTFSLWHAALHRRRLVRHIRGTFARVRAVSRELVLASALVTAVLLLFIGHAWVV